jgi:hypothetical protein
VSKSASKRLSKFFWTESKQKALRVSKRISKLFNGVKLPPWGKIYSVLNGRQPVAQCTNIVQGGQKNLALFLDKLHLPHLLSVADER